MSWKVIQSKLRKVVEYVEKHKVLDIARKKLLKEIPVFGDIINDYWDSLKGSKGEKAEQIIKLLRELVGNNENYFNEMTTQLEKQREEIISGNQSLDKIRDDVAMILGEVGKLGEDHDDIKRMLAKDKRRSDEQHAEMMALLKRIEIHSSKDAMKGTTILSLEDKQRVREIEEFNKAIRMKGISINPDIWYNLGLLALSEGRFTDAEEYLLEVVTIKPEFGDAHTGLAMIYQLKANEHLGNRNYNIVGKFLEESERHIEKAIELDVTDLSALIQRGYIFKEWAQAYNRIGMPQKMTELLKKAKDQFQKVLAKDPRNADAYNGMGNVYLLQKDYDMSISQIKKAIKIMPDYLYAHHDLGIAYHHQGKTDSFLRKECYEKAIAEYKCVLELNKKNHLLPARSAESILMKINKLKEYIDQNQDNKKFLPTP